MHIPTTPVDTILKCQVSSASPDYNCICVPAEGASARQDCRRGQVQRLPFKPRRPKINPRRALRRKCRGSHIAPCGPTCTEGASSGSVERDVTRLRLKPEASAARNGQRSQHTSASRQHLEREFGGSRQTTIKAQQFGIGAATRSRLEDVDLGAGSSIGRGDRSWRDVTQRQRDCRRSRRISDAAGNTVGCGDADGGDCAGAAATTAGTAPPRRIIASERHKITGGTFSHRPRSPLAACAASGA